MGYRQIAFFGASFQDTQLSVERWAQGWQSNIVSIIIWFAITQKLSSHNGHQLFQFCNQRLSVIIFLFVISSFTQLKFFSSFNQAQFILSISMWLFTNIRSFGLVGNVLSPCDLNISRIILVLSWSRSIIFFIRHLFRLLKVAALWTVGSRHTQCH